MSMHCFIWCVGLPARYRPKGIVRDVLSGIASFGRSYQDVEHMKGVRPSTGLVERRGRSDSSRQRATTIIGKALQRTRNSPPSDLVAENKGHAGMSIVALLGGGLRVWLSVLARIQAQLERICCRHHCCFCLCQVSLHTFAH